ncbi:zinc finger C3HC-type protein 1-like [Nematostella vectensis]|uniref:zinc finger C3HC-type protein 1-like n=1 Tax=Nematostella vectensis TaxID=45351 RepID=UPI002076DD37|nr:zinc finger C3HC-type protein 1-like [Nematostella vectensis]XP_032243136.2 zinc finger C3HC-type protein 1-like [Nematostella vectensis]
MTFGSGVDRSKKSKMAACVAGTPRRVKSLLSSFLHSPSTNDHQSKEKEETDAGCEEKSGMYKQRGRDAFWNRVETFSPFTWFAKPMELSPLHCALYGWENADVDILQCVSCKACVDATMSSNWDPEMFAKTCLQLKDSLVAGHTKFCPWPDNPCPESFLGLPTNTPVQWKEDFRMRCQALLDLGASLPLLDSLTYKDMDEVTEDGLEQLQKAFQSCDQGMMDEEDMEQAVRTSCVVALCGWKYRPSDTDADGHTLFCTMCRREVGLWNFKSLTSPSPSASPCSSGRLDDPSGPLEAMSMSDDIVTDSSSLPGSERLMPQDSMEVAVSQKKGFIRSPIGLKRSRDTESSGQEHEIDTISDSEEHKMEMEMKHRLQGEEESPQQDSTQGLTHATREETQDMRTTDWAMVVGDNQSKEGLTRELLQLPLHVRPLSGRSSPISGRYGSENLSYRSPLHHSLSDLSDKGHCESLCVEVEDESLTEKLQAVESELEFMSGGNDSSDRGEYTPERKRIRLQDIEKGTFNPISEHRSWCPWVTCSVKDRGRSSNDQGTNVGWKMLLHTILPNLGSGKEHSYVESPPQDAWKSVRRVLNEGSSSTSSRSDNHSK